MRVEQCSSCGKFQLFDVKPTDTFAGGSVCMCPQPDTVEEACRMLKECSVKFHALEAGAKPLNLMRRIDDFLDAVQRGAHT